MTRSLLIVSAATFLLMVFINMPQLGDPLIRHDDYPAYFGDEMRYYEKTLAEGRWLNFWWMSRETIWPASIGFLHYLLGWSLFCAGTAVAVFGPGVPLAIVAFASAVIALSPQAYLISAWFNTLGLGVWVLAVFAVLSVYVSARTARYLFLVFAPISMLAYTTYPLVLSAILFAHHDTRRSWRDLVVVLVCLAASIIFGMLLMYTLNYIWHGVFGLQIADWRAPMPATNLSELWGNAQTILPLFFESILTSTGYGLLWVGALNIGLLLLALVVLFSRTALEPTYLLAGLSVGVAILMANALKEGVDIPMRAMIGAWIMFAVILARALFVLVQNQMAKPALLAAGLVVSIYSGQLLKNTRFFTDWLSETRSLAAQLPEDAENFVIFGSLWALPGASEARISHFYGLTARLTQLTGLPGINCNNAKLVCPYEPPFDLADADDEVLITRVDDVVFLRMPILPSDNWKPLGQDRIRRRDKADPQPNS